jgi:ribosomal protein L24E
VSRAVEFLDCKKRLRLWDGSRYSVAVSKYPQTCSYCGGEIKPGEPYVVATEGKTRRRLHLKCLMEYTHRVYWFKLRDEVFLCPW